MQALDLLEKRIDAITRMIGPIPEAQTSGGENAVNSLISAQTMIQDAVKNKENITKVMNRSEELEKYLDLNFVDDTQQVRTKEVYLNAIAPDLVATCEQLQQVKALEPALGAEYFRNIPTESTDKLKQIAADNGEFAQQAELIEESLILVMKRYGELQTSLISSLNDMKSRLDGVEQRLQKTKKEQLLKDVPPKEE